MNPKLTNYYRDWRRWETATGKLWVILVLGTIILEVILYIGILLSFVFEMPGENWAHNNMSEWLAIVDLIYVFGCSILIVVGLDKKIPLYLLHTLGVIFLVALYFAGVASQKKPWVAWVCFIVSGLVYLFIRMRKKTMYNENNSKGKQKT